MSSSKERAQAAIDAARDSLTTLSHEIHTFAELAFEEHQSAKRLADVLEESGFDLQRGVAGLETAFVATRGSGDLHVALCCEYDALPGLGHACGHNIIAAAGLGAALGLADLVDELGLTLHVIGTPAEEGGGGKIIMLERGVFDGVHAAMMMHPGPADVALAEPFAVRHVHVHYDGKSAHAATYPDEGINAADAFTVAEVAIGLLRQQLPPSVRVHGIVTNAGTAPNAIPESSDGRWYIRAGSLDELDTIEPKVVHCFEAGAWATGTTLTLRDESPRYSEFRNYQPMVDAFLANAQALGRPFDDAGAIGRMNRASTDMGNVSLQIPSIHPYFGIDSFPALNHQRAFADASVTPAADRALYDAAVSMAWTIIDIATQAPLRNALVR